VYGGAECSRLDGFDAGLLAKAADNMFWIRVHAEEVTGRSSCRSQRSLHRVQKPLDRAALRQQ